MRDEFSRFHPTVSFFWFLFVLIFAMFFMHPAFLAVSLVCSAVYAVFSGGARRLRGARKILLPMACLAAVLNPLFSHEGVTVLAYFPSGNPLTLESVLYGISAAGMLSSTVLWFFCFSSVMTSDKLVYLFGRLAPSISLLLSMTLRFVPRFAAQLRKIRAAQEGIGCDASEGGVIERARHGVRIISIATTWALENSIDTADSMRGRGFGTSARSAFSIYKFTSRDASALAFTFAAAGYVVVGALSGAAGCNYFPAFSAARPPLYGVSVTAAYFALCAMPTFLDLLEEIKWKRIQSKI